jgi:V/A-type H+-transporting ATPase subunit I
MSRVSVTGSKAVMDDVVDAVHDLRLLHMTDYDGAWEGFDPGNPTEGADDVSEKLVTVRSLKSILDVDGESADRHPRILDDEELATELEEIRTRVNDLDDRRDDLREELRSVEEELDVVEPFVDLGIDLDLLSGYDSLSVAVGEGDPSAVREALTATPGVEQFELFTGDDGALAVFAYTAGEDVGVADALVGAQFTGLDVPDVEGSPEGYVSDLRDRKATLESKLGTVESELEDVRAETSGFLLAAEEQLAIDVQKREAPLSFATTENAFVAEGWIPSIRYDDLVTSVTDAVGDHVEIEKHGEAEYDEDGFPRGDEEAIGDPVAADGGVPAGDTSEGGEKRAVSDGGVSTRDVAMSGGLPPVIQDNPGVVKPFEALVEGINRPKYSELDPTLILFLTFPVFFGFMIGDLGYGLLYMGIGYLLIKRFDSDVVKSLGGVAVLSGLFTAIFGVLYGEFFGLHQLGYILFPSGDPPIHKGLQPHYIQYAQAWLLLSVVAGVVHMVVGRTLDFVNKLHHGVGEAFVESMSWVMMIVGLWLWVFSTIGSNAKPPFMFEVFSSGEAAAIPLGFTGFSPTLGWGGVGLAVVGLVLAVYAEGGIALVESISDAFGKVISYTRLAAVLLAKAGMALAVNLLVFGAYAHDGEFHLIFFASPAELAEATANNWIIFNGLLNGEGAAALVLGGLAGLVVMALGHLLVLILGVTSAGLQAVRLEYVEFFGTFYEGGGRKYEPFGYERTYTTED